MLTLLILSGTDDVYVTGDRAAPVGNPCFVVSAEIMVDVMFSVSCSGVGSSGSSTDADI